MPRPDRAAQRLRTGRTKVITLMVNPSHEYRGFTNVLLLGIDTSLKGTGYVVNIVPDFIDSDRLGAIGLFLGPDRPDGIVCVGEVMALAASAAIHDAGLKPGRDVGVVIKQASPVFDLIALPVGARGRDGDGPRHRRAASAPDRGRAGPCTSAGAPSHGDLALTPPPAPQQTSRKRSTMTSSTSFGSRSHQSAAEKISTSQGPA
jgi:hypothetical protein